MAPRLWACSSTHGRWTLRANSTDTVNFPRSVPASDTVTRESANTHLSSSAGSGATGGLHSMRFCCSLEMCQNQVVRTVRDTQWCLLSTARTGQSAPTTTSSPMLDMNAIASAEARSSSPVPRAPVPAKAPTTASSSIVWAVLSPNRQSSELKYVCASLQQLHKTACVGHFNATLFITDAGKRRRLNRVVMETTLQYRKGSCMCATESGSKQATVFPTKEVNPTFSLAVIVYSES